MQFPLPSGVKVSIQVQVRPSFDSKCLAVSHVQRPDVKFRIAPWVQLHSPFVTVPKLLVHSSSGVHSLFLLKYPALHLHVVLSGVMVAWALQSHFFVSGFNYKGSPEASQLLTQ